MLSNFGPTYKEALDYLIWFIYQQVDIETETAEITRAFHEGVFEEKDPSEEILRPQSSIVKIKPICCTMEEAIEFVCSHSKLSTSDLSSSSRKKNLVDARSVLALLVQRSENLNFSQLSMILDRDASSVSRLASKADSREDLRELVKAF